ncbi:MAG: hypothetical protein KDA28_03590, partial [Phycisphaerales bacterium]|nr:hypothetical protein [Phycisphaerales bacterium]
MSDRQRRAGEIFREACLLPESERAPFVEASCGDDEALHRLVTLLLKHDSEPDAAIDALDSGGAVVAIEREMTPEIEGFEIGALIGRGGMGVVYEAV